MNNSSAKKRILIGSCGGLTGIYLAKYFSNKDNCIIYGFDCASLSAGELFVDKFYHLPHAEADEFINSLIHLINSEKIDYYFPTHSKEIRKISEFEVELREHTSVKFLVCPKETFLALENKEQAYYSLSASQIPTPAIITQQPHSYPIVMKGHFGSGSSEVKFIDNEKIFLAHKETYNGVSFFEYIKGTEYTADCIFDNDGKLIFHNLRERIKTIGGAVVIAKNVRTFDILPWLKKLEQNWKFHGCVNFQFIVKENIPYLIDVNLRFPSGGLPLTIQSGINIPEIMIRLMNNEKINETEYPIDPRVSVMYRYYDEIYGYDIT